MGQKGQLATDVGCLLGGVPRGRRAVPEEGFGPAAGEMSVSGPEQGSGQHLPVSAPGSWADSKAMPP